MEAWLALMAQMGASGMAAVSQDEQQSKANRARQDALDTWSSVKIPKLTDYTAPELRSQMDDVQADPRLKDAQMEALSRMMGRSKDGWSVEDRAAMQNARNDVNQHEQAQRGAVMNNMAQRGMAGSGMELAQQLAAQQGGANRMGQFGTNQAAEAQRRALQALQSTGDMSHKMRGQDFDEQAQRARAHDSINQLNAGYNMWAQQGNNNNRSQRFNMGTQLAAGKTGQFNNNASSYEKQGEVAADRWLGTGRAAGEVISGYGEAQDKKKKESP